MNQLPSTKRTIPAKSQNTSRTISVSIIGDSVECIICTETIKLHDVIDNDSSNAFTSNKSDLTAVSVSVAERDSSKTRFENQNPRLFTLTSCEHPEDICSICFLRIRAVRRSNNCPSCKTPLEYIICLPSSSSLPKKKFGDFTRWGDSIGEDFVYESRGQAFFPRDYHQQVVAPLFQYRCKLCPASRRDFKQLKGHYAGEHKSFICELCHEFKQIFPSELTVYNNAAEFDRHLRNGDNDGCIGHPMCEFCKVRYYDTHALFIHLQRDHFVCHLCEKSGKTRHKYYHHYTELEQHFRNIHFLCEEPMCLQDRYICFANEIDLLAHQRQRHPYLHQSSNKVVVPMRFTYTTPGAETTEHAPSKSSGDKDKAQGKARRFEGGLGGVVNDGEWQVELQNVVEDPRDRSRSTAYALPVSESRSSTTGKVEQIVEDFPNLPPSSAAASGGSLAAQKWVAERLSTKGKGSKAKDDFPALPPAPPKKKSISAPSTSSRTAGLSFAPAESKAAPAKSSNKTFTEAPDPPSVSLDSYDFDLARALQESLRDLPSSKSSNKVTNDPSKEAFTIVGKAPSEKDDFPTLSAPPNLGSAPNASTSTNSTNKSTNESIKAFKSTTTNKKPAMSGDIASLLKSAGYNPSTSNNAKKKASLSVVRTGATESIVSSKAKGSATIVGNEPSAVAIQRKAFMEEARNAPEKTYGGWVSIGGADKYIPPKASPENGPNDKDFPTLSNPSSASRR